MDDFIMIMLKFKGEIVVCNVEAGSNFDSLVRDFSLKWPRILVSKVAFHYSIGSYANVSLSNQADYKNMIMVAKLMSVGMLNVDVSEVVDIQFSEATNPPGEKVCSPIPNPCSNKAASHLKFGFALDEFCTGNGVEIARSSSSRNPQNIVKQPIEPVDSESECSYDDSDYFDDLPVFDINPVHREKDLLTDKWGSLISGAGQVFSGGVVQFRHDLIKYCFKIGFDFDYKKNKSDRVVVFCTKKQYDSCGWFIKAIVSPVDKSFRIKKANLSHSCKLMQFKNNTKRIGCEMISEFIIDKVRTTPSFSPIQVISYMNDNYDMIIKYGKARRSVEKARGKLFGTFEESFQELEWYTSALKETNPGSWADIEADSNNTFSRLFIAFRACLDGFKSCRPMLCIDGTFMKARFRGTLLSATAKDGNQQLFPVAFAVVMGETKENWIWFLKKLKAVINCDDVLFMSDRNIGLMEAFPEVFDNPRNFYCLYHLFQNLRSRYPGKAFSPIFKDTLCHLLKECAYSPTIRIFEHKLHEFVREGGQVAADFVRDLPYHKWALSHSTDMRYGELTSNAAESFNKWILEARCLPITHMVDCLRIKIMKWFCERRDLAQKWNTVLCKKMDTIWKKNVNAGSSWQVRMASEFIFEVFSNPTVQVNILERKCSCYQWQVMGFPCCHAAAVICRFTTKIEDIIDPFFLADYHRNCYASVIMPVSTTWRYTFPGNVADFPILPPEQKRTAGRPPTKRKKGSTEGKEKKFIFCTRCRKLGHHNKRSCRVPIRLM